MFWDLRGCGLAEDESKQNIILILKSSDIRLFGFVVSYFNVLLIMLNCNVLCSIRDNVIIFVIDMPAR